ncbi:MAG: hypothetical protein CMJ78_07265 [Planctomycetaceae bacterium]|nr:hypothetical protein [Planctomycetaceae bacterium]
MFVSAGNCCYEGDEPILHYGLIKEVGKPCEFSYVTFARYDADKQSSNGLWAKIELRDGIRHYIDKLAVRDQAFHLEFDAAEEERKFKIEAFKVNDKEVDLTKGNVFLVDFTKKRLKYAQIKVELPANPWPAKSTKDTKALGAEIRAYFADNKKVQAFLNGKLPLTTLPPKKKEKRKPATDKK